MTKAELVAENDRLRAEIAALRRETARWREFNATCHRDPTYHAVRRASRRVLAQEDADRQSL